MNKKKILIIDDSPCVVSTLKGILQKENFDVSIAYVGKVGLEKIKTERPDLVVLDILLPDMDGYQVCEKIKQDFQTKDIPIVMLTGKDMGEDFDEAMSKKADWYIVKPYNPPHLLKVLKKLLKD